MNEFLDSNPVVDRRYFKLMYLACANVIIAVPSIVFLMVLGTLGTDSTLTAPYISWHFVHEYIGTIVQVPASEWSQGGWLAIFTIKWDEWSYIVFFLPVFFFFGMTNDVKATVFNSFWLVTQRLGVKRSSAGQLTTKTASNLVFAPPSAARVKK